MIAFTLSDLEAVEVVSVKDLVESDLPEPDYVVEGLIPERAMTIVAARQGVGKSFLAMYLACCCATGKPFLNLKTKKCRVLYIDEENGLHESKRRFQRLSTGLRIDTESLDAIGLESYRGVLLTSEEGREKILHLVRKKKPQLVIVDCLVRVMTGNENDVEAVRAVFAGIKPILQEGVAVVVLHHVRKAHGKAKLASIDDVRGSSDLSASAASVLLLNQDSQGLKLTQEKSRCSQGIQEAVCFKFENVNLDGALGIQIKYLQPPEKELSIPEIFSLKILDWLKKANLLVFETKDVKAHFSDYTQSARTSALNILKEKGSIAKAGQGKWKVNSSLFSLSHYMEQ